MFRSSSPTLRWSKWFWEDWKQNVGEEGGKQGLKKNNMSWGGKKMTNSEQNGHFGYDYTKNPPLLQKQYRESVLRESTVSTKEWCYSN